VNARSARRRRPGGLVNSSANSINHRNSSRAMSPNFTCGSGGSVIRYWNCCEENENYPLASPRSGWPPTSCQRFWHSSLWKIGIIGCEGGAIVPQNWQTRAGTELGGCQLGPWPPPMQGKFLKAPLKFM
jgi:hypothetical protein